MHTWKNYPYVGYGHQLQPGERFTADMTERQADSLLRADLWKCFEHFKGYGKDALLLTLLAYNVGVGRLLGYGKHPKCRLAKDRSRRQKLLSGVCFVLPIQGESFEWISQAPKGRVCVVLYSMTI